MFEPLIDSSFKLAMKSTKTEWDDFAYDILSEFLQAYLFVYFSSYAPAAVMGFSIFCGIQVFLLVVQKVLDINYAWAPDAPKGPKTAEELAAEDAEDVKDYESARAQCGLGGIMTVVITMLPLGMTAMQQDSPFHTQSFEVVLTVYFWVIGTMVSLAMVQLDEMIHGITVSEITMRQIQKTVTIVGVFAYFMMWYMYVLNWTWSQSPLIEAGYDIFTVWVNIICQTPLILAMACVPCLLPGILLGA